ncbi:MAG: hypothetical protein WA253_06535 [Gammaproteobacteria bacterium]
MEGHALLSDTDDDVETLPVDQDNLQTKLTHIAELQPSISTDLLTHHETPSQKKLRLFIYITFLALALITTLVSQVLPNFVKLGRSDKEKKSMDISSWVLTGISVIAFIIYWPFSKPPESKKLSTLKDYEKEKIRDLSFTLEKVQADCHTQFADEEEKALYSSTAVMLTNMITKLRDEKKSSIKQTYQEINNVKSMVETIGALDRSQGKKKNLLVMMPESEELSFSARPVSSF